MPVELPEQAKSRLRDLELAKMSAEDAMRGTAMRLSGLSPDADPELCDKLAGERQRQSHRHSQLTQLVSRCRQWLAELPRDSVLQVAPPISGVELKPGAIEAARHEIAALRQQLIAVRGASLPVSDQKALAEQYVVKLMRQGKPTVAVVRDELKVTPRGDMVAAEDVLALLAWAAPDAVLRSLEREIDHLPERSGALPQSERLARVAELEAQLLTLERHEESLIMQAAAVGQEVLPRLDMSPLALLNVALVKNPSAVEAA
jgi:hypothetical protein